LPSRHFAPIDTDSPGTFPRYAPFRPPFPRRCVSFASVRPAFPGIETKGENSGTIPRFGRETDQPREWERWPVEVIGIFKAELLRLIPATSQRLFSQRQEPGASSSRDTYVTPKRSSFGDGTTCIADEIAATDAARADSPNSQRLRLAYPRLADVPTWRIFESVVTHRGRRREDGERRGALEGFRTTEVCGIVSIWLDILQRRSTLPQPRQDLEICFLCAALVRWM